MLPLYGTQTGRSFREVKKKLTKLPAEYEVFRWGFQIFFVFSPQKLGKMNPFWRAYFSNGLKPPIRWCRWGFRLGRWVGSTTSQCNFGSNVEHFQNLKEAVVPPQTPTLSKYLSPLRQPSHFIRWSSIKGPKILLSCWVGRFGRITGFSQEKNMITCCPVFLLSSAKNHRGLPKIGGFPPKSSILIGFPL